VNLDYPTGKPDAVEYAERGSKPTSWTSIPISGNNFPDGFMGPMGALQSYVEGSTSNLPTHFEDAYETMALIEALYRSSDNAAVYIPLRSQI
jgi:predicted dehydrogenase